MPARLRAVAGPARPRAVVWDVGHVLYDWDPRYLYRKLIDDPERLDWFLSNVVTREWHFQHDAGRPFAETSAELIGRFPAEAALIRLYGPRWLETLPGPIPGTHALVERLAAAGVPQFAITNFSAEFWESFQPTAPVLRHFRDIVVSGRERLLKPDPAIFHLALQRFGLGCGEALFIDDNAANVEAAAASGLLPHLFRSADSLAQALDAVGLLPVEILPVPVAASAMAGPNSRQRANPYR
mgnify:FL=1